MSFTLDGPAFIAAIRQLAADHPDRIYLAPPADGACRYTRSADKPDMGCLIGEALMVCGIPREVLTVQDDAGPVVFLGLMSIWGIDGLNGAESRWASHVQHSQDCGDRWSDCVVRADSEKPLV